MAFIEWTDDLDLPLPGVNAQHQELYARTNAFHAALVAGDERADELLLFLADYVREHFADEERLMARMGYPGLAEHEAEHRRLEGEVEALVRGWMTGEDRSGDALLGFMSRWLADHIRRWDVAFASYARAAKRAD